MGPDEKSITSFIALKLNRRPSEKFPNSFSPWETQRRVLGVTWTAILLQRKPSQQEVSRHRHFLYQSQINYVFQCWPFQPPRIISTNYSKWVGFHYRLYATSFSLFVWQILFSCQTLSSILFVTRFS